jgi:hypothetical protein
MHIFIRSKIRHSHRQYDTRRRRGTKPGTNRAKGWPVGHLLRRATRVWHLFEIRLNHVYPTWERWCCHKASLPDQVKWPADLTSGPPEPQFQPRHQLKRPINTVLLLSVEV